jgi:2-iminobutanoate/2-iminopropanoate deaminase
MKIKKITIDPDPYEPFRLAQGYRVGELLFISGQAAIDGNGQLVGVGNFDAQAAQVFANLERVLRAGGSSLANVIKVTIFLRDMSNFPKIVELRGRQRRPVRAHAQEFPICRLADLPVLPTRPPAPARYHSWPTRAR